MLRFLWRMMLSGGVFCFGMMLLTSSAQALSISPSLIEERLQPGESKMLSLTVVNDETEPIRLYASLQKFLPLGTSGQQRFLPPNDTAGIPSWTFVSIPDMPLQPGERRNIPVQFRVPLDAPQGGAYEALFLSTQRPVGANESNIGLRSRIGVLVLLHVGDRAKTVLRLTDWRMDEPTRRSSLHGIVHVTLYNAGTSHVRPTGELVVRNMFGRVTTRVPLNLDAGRILPASERTFEVKFGPAPQADHWLGTVLDELAAFGFGSYTLSLEGVDGLEMAPNDALRITVWPWHLFVSVLVLLVVFVIVLRAYRARLVRRLQRSS